MFIKPVLENNITVKPVGMDIRDDTIPALQGHLHILNITKFLFYFQPFDFIECFTFLFAHSWLNWVD